MRKAILVIFLLLPASSIASGGRSEIPIAAGLPGWSSWTRSGVPPAQFVVDRSGAMVITAERGFGLVYHELPPVERRRPILRWHWRVDLAQSARAPVDAAHDDRPIAVHLWFPEAPEDDGFFASLRRTLGGWLDLPTPGRVLTYSWGGVGPVGPFLPSPALGEVGRLRILRGDDTPHGQEFGERIDIAADYVQAFGRPGPSPAPTHVAVSADMEDTDGRSLAAITGLFLADE